MVTFTASDYPDLTDMIAQWRFDAALGLLFGSGMLSVAIWGLLVLAVVNIWRGLAGRDDVRFVDYVGDLITSLLR